MPQARSPAGGARAGPRARRVAVAAPRRGAVPCASALAAKKKTTQPRERREARACLREAGRGRNLGHVRAALLALDPPHARRLVHATEFFALRVRWGRRAEVRECCARDRTASGVAACAVGRHGDAWTHSHRGRRGERARRVERDPPGRRVRDGDRGRRLQGARQARGLRPRRHPHRSEDARARRDRVHGEGQGRGARRRLRGDDRVRDDPERRRGGEKGGRELPHQAARLRGARGGDRAGDGEGAPPSRDAAAARSPARAERVRPHRDERPEDARGARAGGAGRAHARERARHRRERHRQGAHRRGHPRRQPALGEALRAAALRISRRVAPRERAFRARARRVHRSHRAARRALQAGRRRDALSRRDRRDPRRHAGEAPSLPSGARVRAGRRQRDAEGRRPHHRRHEPRPPGGDREGGVPRGPLLPAQRRRRGDPPAARPQGGHRGPRQLLPPPVRRRERPDDRRLQRRRARPADRLCLARKRAGARERDRARGGALQRAADRGEAPPRGGRPAGGARRGAADPGLHDSRSRAVRDPEDARGVRRLDVEGGDDPRRVDAQDPVQAPRVRRPAPFERRPRRSGRRAWEEIALQRRARAPLAPGRVDGDDR